MTDDREDRMDELLREAAQEYHRPPPVPREEIWARVQAARKARQGSRPAVIDLASRRTIWSRSRTWVALAAVLVLGVTIGRLSLRSGVGPEVPAPSTAAQRGPARSGPSEAAQLAAVQHLSRVETLLTEYRAGEAGSEFHAAAKDLLAQTRLWLDGKRMTDPRVRALLEDLELVLVQIVQLEPKAPGDEREIIDQGMTEHQIPARLRAAIPAGPSA
jgi:hypothetical protein